MLFFSFRFWFYKSKVISVKNAFILKIERWGSSPPQDRNDRFRPFNALCYRT